MPDNMTLDGLTQIFIIINIRRRGSRVVVSGVMVSGVMVSGVFLKVFYTKQIKI